MSEKETHPDGGANSAGSPAIGPRRTVRIMIGRLRRGPYGVSPALGYSIAMLLGAAAQIARIPLQPATRIPFITYVPFMLLSAALGGFGPGLLTTGICLLECLYFVTASHESFGADDAHLRGGLEVLACTGLVISILFEFLKRAWRVNTAAAVAAVRLARDLETQKCLLESIVQNSPVAIAVVRGPEFRFTLVNGAYEALVPGEHLVGRTVASVWPATAPEIIPSLNVVRDAGTAYHVTGYILPGDLGQAPPVEERCFDFSLVPLTGRGAVNEVDVLEVAVETTGHKRAEAALARQRDELQRQSELINFSHDAIITADANRVIRGWNRGAEELYGWTEGEAIGNVIHLLLRTSCSLTVAQINDVLWREDQWDGELEHSRRDGQRILVDSRQVLLCNAGGTDSRILEIDRDITQRRCAEVAFQRIARQVEAALAEKTVLLKEIHHRVKNNLAVTASLLSMKADGCGCEARLALEESRQRIYTIALVHDHLYCHEGLDCINFGGYARDLVHSIHSTFGGELRCIRLDLRLEPIELSIERAVPCALVLNELLSNAYKYAFADGRAGRIQVSFRQPEPGCCELAVEDDGIGLPDEALNGQQTSLGLRIVHILTSQLDGSVEQQACTGTRIVLRFPAAA